MNAEFWNMGGYAVFVWGSYALGAAVLLWNVVSPWWQRRSLLAELRESAGDEA